MPDAKLLIHFANEANKDHCEIRFLFSQECQKCTTNNFIKKQPLLYTCFADHRDLAVEEHGGGEGLAADALLEPLAGVGDERGDLADDVVVVALLAGVVVVVVLLAGRGRAGHLGALLAGVAVHHLAAGRRHVLLVERVQRVSEGSEEIQVAWYKIDAKFGW